MTEADFIDLLKAAAARHLANGLAAKAYDLDATTTEYLLTAAVVTEAIARNHVVRAEARYLKIANLITTNAPAFVKRLFGLQRLDILIGSELAPLAVAELKIRVRTASKLISDADKLLGMHTLLKGAARIPAVLVFEVALKGNARCVTKKHFRMAFLRLFLSIRADLSAHVAHNWGPRRAVFRILSYDIIEAVIGPASTIHKDGAAVFLCAAVLR